MATIDEIRTDLEDAVAAIGELDAKLGEERKAIKLKAFLEKRDLTAAELSRRREIAATRLELGELLQALALETISQLETSEEIDTHIHELETINGQLADDLEHLKTLQDYAEKAAKVANVLAKVTAFLTKLRPSP